MQRSRHVLVVLIGLGSLTAPGVAAAQGPPRPSPAPPPGAAPDPCQTGSVNGKPLAKVPAFRVRVASRRAFDDDRAVVELGERLRVGLAPVSPVDIACTPLDLRFELTEQDGRKLTHSARVFTPPACKEPGPGCRPRTVLPVVTPVMAGKPAERQTATAVGIFGRMLTPGQVTVAAVSEAVRVEPKVVPVEEGTLSARLLLTMKGSVLDEAYPVAWDFPLPKVAATYHVGRQSLSAEVITAPDAAAAKESFWIGEPPQAGTPVALATHQVYRWDQNWRWQSGPHLVTVRSWLTPGHPATLELLRAYTERYPSDEKAGPDLPVGVDPLPSRAPRAGEGAPGPASRPAAGGGPPAGAPSPPLPASSSCGGCAAAPSGPALFGAALLLTFAAAWRRRRR